MSIKHIKASDLKTPKVSVIMNCLNCSRYLREAIDSVYAQTFKDWEIIFWDNASTDNSANIAKNYDERLRYFSSESTMPLGEARNMAMEQARGEFIAFLDCDDLWMPEKLEKQLPLFDDHEVGLVFSDSIVFNSSGYNKRFYHDQKFYTGHCFAKLISSYFIDIETVVIRRSVLNDIEWFDPRFNLIEDADFVCKIGYRWKLAMVNEPLAKWRAHQDSWTWTKGHLVAGETDAMLEKFANIFPNFSEQFAEDIRILKKDTSTGRAKHLWKAGERAKARRVLVPYIFESRKALALFVLTFFPERMLAPIIKRFSKVVLPS